MLNLCFDLEAKKAKETSERAGYATNLHKCSDEEKENELKIKTFVVIKKMQEKIKQDRR